MKYLIKYIQNGHLTNHHFDSTKELKDILKELKGIQVQWYFDCNNANVKIICIEHNQTALPSVTTEEAANTSNEFKKYKD